MFSLKLIAGSFVAFGVQALLDVSAGYLTPFAGALVLLQIIESSAISLLRVVDA